MPRRFTDEPAIALARKLAEIAPGTLGKVLFATGGSDAIDIALKLARAATGRFKTLSFWDAFHGAGFGGISIGGEAIFRSGPIGPLFPGAEHVAPFAGYRCPYGYPDSERRSRPRAVPYELRRHGRLHPREGRRRGRGHRRTVARRPYLPPPGYWQAVREACNAHDTLLVFDEVPTGLGKTGRMFACEHFDCVPDILVLGKALGGGMLPIAAVIARPELDVVPDRAVGHYTHEKNPLTCRAALTTIDIIESEGLVERARDIGAHALERLDDMKVRHRIIGDVRAIGCVIGIELVLDRNSKAPAVDAAEQVLYRALELGLNFKTTMVSVLTLTPPLVTTHAEMDAALGIIDRCLAECNG